MRNPLNNFDYIIEKTRNINIKDIANILKRMRQVILQVSLNRCPKRYKPKLLQIINDYLLCISVEIE